MYSLFKKNYEIGKSARKSGKKELPPESQILTEKKNSSIERRKYTNAAYQLTSFMIGKSNENLLIKKFQR